MNIRDRAAHCKQTHMNLYLVSFLYNKNCTVYMSVCVCVYAAVLLLATCHINTKPPSAWEWVTIPVPLYVFVCERLTADGDKLQRHFFPILPIDRVWPFLHCPQCVWPALLKLFYSDGVNLWIMPADIINILWDMEMYYSFHNTLSCAFDWLQLWGSLK